MRRPCFILAALLAAVAPVSAETEIRIVGGQAISNQELFTTIGGRLDHIRLHPATPPRAADAAFLVEQTFRQAGFNDVAVSWKIVNGAIELSVDEKGRALLGEVAVENIPNPKLNKALVELFKLGPRKAATGMNQFPLRDSDVEEGLGRMQAQMKSIGFYDAVFHIKDRRENPETGKVDFVFTVDHGPISVLGRPVIEGETVTGIRDRLEPLVGQAASTPNLNSARARVVEAYQEAGFLNAKVRMSVRREGPAMTPVFRIERGRRVKLRDVRITGFEKTDPARLLSRVDDLRGTYLDGGESSRRIQQMIATGAFSTIRTELTPVEGEIVDATLHVTEADARGLSATLGFDSFEGGILGGAYYDRNFNGKVRSLSAGFEVTGRSLLGEISLADPWVAGSDIGGKLRLFAVSRNYEGYKVTRSGLAASAVWQVGEHYSIEGLLGWDYVTTEPDGLPAAALGSQDYAHARLEVTQVFDYRDNPVLPTKGWHLEVPLEIGSTMGDGATSYFKGGIAGSYHRPVGKSAQLSVGARGGVLIPSASAARMPIDLRYFLGGARSVRSFPERELGPWSSTGYPVGGQAYWCTNIEYIHSLAGPLKGVAFIDAGGLSGKWEDFGMTSPKVAAGLGIRLDLPIGPVRLEYGHNLTRDGHDPSGSWHFAIGTAF
jgi:outer membrane protein assembly factor BamA